MVRKLLWLFLRSAGVKEALSAAVSVISVQFEHLLMVVYCRRRAIADIAKVVSVTQLTGPMACLFARELFPTLIMRFFSIVVLVKTFLLLFPLSQGAIVVNWRKFARSYPV